MTTLAGSTAGTSGYVDATGTDARFQYPAGVAVDSTGNVYVAEGDNSAIRKVSLAPYAITVAANSGLNTTNAVASNISPGPVSESGQTVSFTVTNDNNALFSVQPAIDASGNLTFTPLATASGTAIVTVTAVDNGGTANGGVDTSAAQTFTITVTAPPPTVTNVTPTSGSTAGGTSVTITGTNFTGATGVTFGGTAATNVVVSNATTITATTPAGTAGLASVVVTTPGGANAANALFAYAEPVPNSFPATGALTGTVKGFIDLDAAPLTGGAEIPAFDPASKRAFTSSNSGIQVIDLTNPSAPAYISTIAPASLGVSGLTSNDVSSVAVRKGAGGSPSVLAAAIISSPKSSLGYVVFLNAATGALLGSAQVGANPDHIAFTPDGTKLLVANEGELDAVNAAPTVIASDTTVGSVSIIPVNAAGAAGTVSTADFTAYDAPATITTLKNAGVRIFQGGKPSTDFEPEYFAISADGSKAMVTLQEANAVAVLDIATATFTSVSPLGKKSFASGRHDFNDRDGVGATALVNPTTGNPVFGLYMPDAIASYSAGGQTYYVTSNEGDDRNDFLNPDETTTVGNAGYNLDDTVFPNETALKNQARLGRLTVSNAAGLRGDTDNDSDIDEILSYGGRSFSILDSNGAIVFDSGDMLENIIASQFPANWDDTRSDNKGPEPEGVTVATLGARSYAFVSLERSHMTLIFDVTNPAAVTFTGGLARSGDLNPEGLVVVPASDSPSGKALLLVASEASQTLTVFELNQTTDYTLQVLHYYGESGLLGIQTAPIMGAMIDQFDNEYANTVVLGEGDSYIPGPWLVAGADPAFNSLLHTTAQVYTGNNGTLGAAGSFNATATATTAVPFGRADIAIMNAFGTTVSALGNHEFDLGSPVVASAFYPATTTGPTAVGNWVGAQFPLITTNLDFANDSSLRGRADLSLGGVSGSANNAPNVNGITAGTIASLEVSSVNMKGKIAPYAVKTMNGQRIGFVGATNWDLLTKTSPNGTVPKDDANAATSDLQEVAAYLQGAVNALQALGVNKIIQVDQLDDLQRNKDLAPLVSGIDIVVAGGGHERMGDANDTAVAFNGHDADFIADAYPIVTAGADGKPVLIVTTDTEYTYLGRLVAEFDADGLLITPKLNNIVNGAYASTEASLQAAYGTSNSAATIIAGSTIGSQVKTIVDAINNVVVTKDSNVYGYTNVYLEGDRVFGRTQEVNLGNISADANAMKARAALGVAESGAVFSLKNGGGLRASVGSVLANGTKVGPLANSITGKPANAISQLDVENALRFDNKLMVFDTTPTGLLNILNFAAGLSNGPAQQSGGYIQVGNLRFSYNSALPTGQKVRSVALVNEAGQITARVVENGLVLASAPSTIQCVALNFTANGGDGYPIKYLNPPTNTTVNNETSNFRYLLTNGTLSAVVARNLDFTAATTFTSLGLTAADILGEQKAFQDFLAARHPNPATAYNIADTPVALDTRIQQLAFRADNVLNDPTVTNVTPAIGSISGGTSVTITGTNFIGATGVTFGGTAATTFTVDSATQITATTPAHAAGAVSVLVTNPNGTNPANTLYTYVPPEIAITGNGMDITSGDITPNTADHTEFGLQIAASGSKKRTFTIRNTSTVALTIGAISFSGAGMADFSVTSAPSSPVLPAGMTSFEVTFDPSAVGLSTALLSIVNDDPNENPFTFTIQGTGSDGTPAVTMEEFAGPGSAGTQLGGAPAGTTLVQLHGTPSLKEDGSSAYSGVVRYPDGTQHHAMVVGGSILLDDMTNVSAMVSFSGPLPANPRFISFRSPLINSSGRVAFIADLVGTGFNRRGVFTNIADGVLKMLMRQGGPDPATGSTFANVGVIALAGDGVIFTATTTDGRTGLYGYDQARGVDLLFRTGNTINAGGTAKTVSAFTILATNGYTPGQGQEHVQDELNPGDRLTTLVCTFTDGSQGVIKGRFNSTAGSYSGFAETYAEKGRLIDFAAGADAVLPLGKFDNGFTKPGWDQTGTYYGFIGQLMRGVAAVGDQTDAAIFVDLDPEQLVMQVREGSAVPGLTGVTYKDFYSLMVGGGDYEFAFLADMRGTGITAANDLGLFTKHTTLGIIQVAREGGAAAGVAGGVFQNLNQMALPGDGQPILSATLQLGTGGVTTANDNGFWVMNGNGELKLAVREGDVITIGGSPRTVSTIQSLSPGNSATAGARIFTADGTLKILVGFTDGTQGFIEVLVP